MTLLGMMTVVVGGGDDVNDDDGGGDKPWFALGNEISTGLLVKVRILWVEKAKSQLPKDSDFSTLWNSRSVVLGVYDVEYIETVKKRNRNRIKSGK